jgi:hypothetical protein
MGLNWWQEKTIEHGVAIDVLDAQTLTANETIAALQSLVSANITAISSLTDNVEINANNISANTTALAESTKLQVNSAMSKAVMRRKGYNDIIPTVANKRVAIIGIHPLSTFLYLYHDSLSYGIPFHCFTFTDFVAKYDTTAWKAAYDIIIIGGTYLDTDTATPTTVKVAIQAIIAGDFYKIIQVSDLGMVYAGQTSAYWFEDLGVTVNEGGTPITNNFATATNWGYTGAPDYVYAADTSYTIIGDCINVNGAALTRMLFASTLTTHWICAAEATKKWAVIGSQGGNNTYNNVVHYGYLIAYLRGIKSGFAFDRINAKKYAAWGWDCDTTDNITAISRLISISGSRLIELGLVTSKLTEVLQSYYRNLQNQGAKIVNHTYDHFASASIPYHYQYPKGTEQLDEYGLASDGIVYSTMDYTKPELTIDAMNYGYLVCGWLNAYRGRLTSYLPVAEVSADKPIAFTTGKGTPRIGTTIDPDTSLIPDNATIEAYLRFTQMVQKCVLVDDELPCIWYWHDLFLTDGWDGSVMTSGNPYHSSQSGYMDLRIKFYTDCLAYIDSLGWTQLRRSEAVEYIYDLFNYASITTETISAGGVTVKAVSSRRINGATLKIPTNAAKTIASVTVDGVTITSIYYERRADNKWLYVGLDLSAGREHTVVVTYA